MYQTCRSRTGDEFRHTLDGKPGTACRTRVNAFRCEPYEHIHANAKTSRLDTRLDDFLGRTGIGGAFKHHKHLRVQVRCQRIDRRFDVCQVRDVSGKQWGGDADGHAVGPGQSGVLRCRLELSTGAKCREHIVLHVSDRRAPGVDRIDLRGIEVNPDDAEPRACKRHTQREACEPESDDPDRRGPVMQPRCKGGSFGSGCVRAGMRRRTGGGVHGRFRIDRQCLSLLR